MNKKNSVKREVVADNKKLIVQQIVQVNVDRTMKDVGKLIEGLRSAESIYYPNRTRLYDLYSSFADLDGHLCGIIGKRISAVNNKNWRFVSNEKDVDDVKSFINTNVFRELVKGIMLSKMWGVTGFEFIPGKEICFEEIPRKHIKPETKIITINQSDQDGNSYDGVTNIFVVGDKKDYGLFLKVAFYALLKKGAVGDWAQYIEIFGQPMRVGKYDAYDEKTKTQLADVLTNAGSSLALMIPKQADFELMDGKVSNGDGQLQERFKNSCNSEMSIAILGNTETTSNDNGGSNAKAKTQGEQQLQITKDDIAFVKNILNTEAFAKVLRTYGLPVDGGMFAVEEEPDPNTLLVDSQIDEALKRMGLPLDDDYFYKHYNRPKPTNYDELKKIQQQQQEAQQLPEGKPDDTKPGSNKKPTKAPVNAKLSAWHKFRLAAADFFDHAHKD